MAMYLGSNKVEIGVNNGGGGSWVTLTEESVTVGGEGGSLTYNTQITADTIKVTFNGTEYTVSPSVDTSPFGTSYTYGAQFSEELDRYDYSTYPFSVVSTSNGANTLHTETAGTYTVKIEAPQSGGGSSDFSTATLTVNGNFTQSDLFIAPVVEKDPNNEDIAFPQIQSGNSTNTVILYKGRSALMYMGSQSRTITVSGNIETVNTGVYIITGDCTITIS